MIHSTQPWNTVNWVVTTSVTPASDQYAQSQWQQTRNREQQSISWSSGQDPSPGVYIPSARLLQPAALRYHGQIVRLRSIQNAAAPLLTSTRRRDHTSSVTFASNGSSSNWLYWSSSRRAYTYVLSGWLRDHRWLLTPSSALGRRQRSHCSANYTRHGDRSFSDWRDRNYVTVFQPHCENQTLKLCSSNDF